MTHLTCSNLSSLFHIAGMTHGGPVKLPMLPAVLQDGLVHGGVGPVRDDTLDLLQLVILVPHCSTISDNTRHAGVNYDITGYMKIGDTFAGVNHGYTWSCFITFTDGRLNFCLLRMSL